MGPLKEYSRRMKFEVRPQLVHRSSWVKGARLSAQVTLRDYLTLYLRKATLEKLSFGEACKVLVVAF